MPFIPRLLKTFPDFLRNIYTFAVIRRRHMILLFKNPAEMLRGPVSDNPADLTDRNIGGFQQFFSARHFTFLYNSGKCLPRLPVDQPAQKRLAVMKCIRQSFILFTDRS